MQTKMDIKSTQRTDFHLLQDICNIYFTLFFTLRTENAVIYITDMYVFVSLTFCYKIHITICNFSFLSPSLRETARYRLKYCLKRPLSPKLTDQPTNLTIGRCIKLLMKKFGLPCWKDRQNQLLQLCTARTAWSDSVIRSETSLITESDRSGQIR